MRETRRSRLRAAAGLTGMHAGSDQLEMAGGTVAPRSQAVSQPVQARFGRSVPRPGWRTRRFPRVLPASSITTSATSAQSSACCAPRRRSAGSSSASAPPPVCWRVMVRGSRRRARSSHTARLWLRPRRAHQAHDTREHPYSFRSALLRQVLYERTPPAARALLHRKLDRRARTGAHGGRSCVSRAAACFDSSQAAVAAVWYKRPVAKLFRTSGGRRGKYPG